MKGWKQDQSCGQPYLYPDWYSLQSWDPNLKCSMYCFVDVAKAGQALSMYFNCHLFSGFVLPANWRGSCWTLLFLYTWRRFKTWTHRIPASSPGYIASQWMEYSFRSHSLTEIKHVLCVQVEFLASPAKGFQVEGAGKDLCPRCQGDRVNDIDLWTGADSVQGNFTGVKGGRRRGKVGDIIPSICIEHSAFKVLHLCYRVVSLITTL